MNLLINLMLFGIKKATAFTNQKSVKSVAFMPY
jgi:hypothetical protein